MGWNECNIINKNQLFNDIKIIPFLIFTPLII